HRPQQPPPARRRTPGHGARARRGAPLDHAPAPPLPVAGHGGVLRRVARLLHRGAPALAPDPRPDRQRGAAPSRRIGRPAHVGVLAVRPRALCYPWAGGGPTMAWFRCVNTIDRTARDFRVVKVLSTIGRSPGNDLVL